MQRRRQDLSGFTLMEIVVVMGIISVLFCLFATFGYTRAKARTTYMACCENLRTIATGLQMYLTENKELPKNKELDKLTPNYLRVLPTCPAAQTDTYTNSYVRDAETNNNFTLYCEGDYHATLGFDTDFPQYSFQWGLMQWLE